MTTQVVGRLTGGADGQISWQGWEPDDDPAGIVVLSHGFAEHSGRYAHVAERLATEGYACYALDHRGHGHSEGVRGNIDRMTGVCADLGRLIALARERHDGLRRRAHLGPVEGGGTLDRRGDHAALERDLRLRTSPAR
jgi:acylglycerol lipase